MPAPAPLHRIRSGLFAFVSVLAAATCCYWLAGNPLLDSLYMVVVTVFGVGYYEVIPATTPILRILNILVIIGGTSTAVYTVSAVLQFMTQGEIDRLLGARRKMHDIKALSGHTIICGYGRMGQILARDLASEKHPFVSIESDESKIRLAESQGHLAIQGNATDENVLIAARINTASHIACVLPSDSDNVFVTLSARTMNPDIMIIARGEVPSTEPKLRQAGASQVILPPSVGASRIAEIIMGSVRGEPDLSRCEVATDAAFRDAGLALCALKIEGAGAALGLWLEKCRSRTSISYGVVGVKDKDQRLLLNLEPSYVVCEGDELLLVCAVSDLAALRKHLGRNSHK